MSVSDDGQRIILITVDDGDNNPELSVYNAAGVSLFHEVLNLSYISESKLSGNGRYVFLAGDPKPNKADTQRLTIIDIDNPAKRWETSIKASTATSKTFIENDSGGFEVWVNKVKLVSFPK
jgi:outer membrane protein assembly factor BamB